MKNMDDYQATIDYAKKISRLEGKLEDAQSMLAEGLDLALVAQITKLPKKQILAMR